MTISIRQGRMENMIKRAVSTMILQEAYLFYHGIDGCIDISHVHMTNDLRIAKIYVNISLPEDMKHDVTQTLMRSIPKMRSVIARELYLKYTPELRLYCIKSNDA